MMEIVDRPADDECERGKGPSPNDGEGRFTQSYVTRLFASLHNLNIPRGGNSTPVRSAIDSLYANAERYVEDAAELDGNRDPHAYPDHNPLPSLLSDLADWSAAWYADGRRLGKDRYRGNPTDTDGRAWFKAEKWIPFLEKLERIIRQVGYEPVRVVACSIIISLARRTIDYKELVLPHSFLTYIRRELGVAGRSGRPQKSIEGRANEYRAAIRVADAQAGHKSGSWFGLSTIKHHGIKNPRDAWCPELRQALKEQRIESRQRIDGKRPWEVRVTRRESDSRK